MKKYRPLVMTALLCALSVILTRAFFAPQFELFGVLVRPNFGLICIIFCGLFFGKYYGLSCGLISDLIGFLISPMGSMFIPLITVGSACAGFLPGFFKAKKINYVAVFFAVLLSSLIHSVFGSYGLAFTFPATYSIGLIILPRALFAVGMSVIYYAVICILVKALASFRD